MKAIDLLKFYKQNLLCNQLKVEIRVNNYTKKVVRYWDFDELKKEPLLQLEIKDWFIPLSKYCDGDIVINVKERVKSGNINNICDRCGIKKGEYCLDPYDKEINKMETWCYLCDECYQERLDSI